MTKQSVFICACLAAGLWSCGSMSNEQGRETADSASQGRLQEGPRGAHTPLNEPENRSTAADTSAAPGTAQEPGRSGR